MNQCPQQDNNDEFNSTMRHLGDFNSSGRARPCRPTQLPGAEVWDRMLKGGDRAVALVNRRTGAAPISVAYVVAEGGGGVAMDVWSGETLGKVKSGGALTITGVCAHCSREAGTDIVHTARNVVVFLSLSLYLLLQRVDTGRKVCCVP